METFSSPKNQSWLPWFLRGLTALGFLILAGRLIDLTVVRGEYFRALSEGNRVRRVAIAAPRGRILARGGETLVGNREVKKKVIFDIREGYKKVEAGYQTVPGESETTITEYERDYILGEAFAHVSGYLGEVTIEELGKVRADCPEKGPRKLGGLVGRGGLEEEYDCILSGIDGELLIEVDSQGMAVRVLGEKEVTPGGDLATNINYGLQKKISEIINSQFPLSEKKAAVVVTDGTGQILGLYSSPSFDPNIFISKEDEAISQILKGKNDPLLNRAISGRFHPGSTFKPIVAIAALEEGAIDEKFKYEDPGVISINTPWGNFSYSNWYFNQYGRREGEIDLTRAITRSTDTFFYKIGELTGIENIAKWANIFGLDKKTGIDLPGENAGFIPSPVWKERTSGERWFLGNTYHVSIGQGDVAVTPLALNTAIGTIANDGIYCSSYLAERGSGNSKFQMTNDECVNLEIKKENIDLVKEGMRGACSAGGTGFTFFDFKDKTGLDVACKTGTAETERGEPHAWFVAFAPFYSPEIIATVLIEEGGEGSRAAGPVAREIFDYWFEVKK